MTALDKCLYGDDKETDNVSDLHTVDENEEDECITTKADADNYVFLEILSELLMSETEKIASGVRKVDSFCHMWLWRTRFLKKRQATIKI